MVKWDPTLGECSLQRGQCWVWKPSPRLESHFSYLLFHGSSASSLHFWSLTFLINDIRNLSISLAKCIRDPHLHRVSSMVFLYPWLHGVHHASLNFQDSFGHIIKTNNFFPHFETPLETTIKVSAVSSSHWSLTCLKESRTTFLQANPNFILFLSFPKLSVTCKGTQIDALGYKETIRGSAFIYYMYI